LSAGQITLKQPFDECGFVRAERGVAGGRLRRDIGRHSSERDAERRRGNLLQENPARTAHDLRLTGPA
jgi:hypothetical protein